MANDENRRPDPDHGNLGSELDQKKLPLGRNRSLSARSNSEIGSGNHLNIVERILDNMEKGDCNGNTVEIEDRAEKVRAAWKSPPTEGAVITGLKLYNSFTRRNELFVPYSGKKVLWYTCGPTVYDHSHLGHARSYISFDILRRVLTDYFKYDVVYTMNITDIDDKIIKRSRVRHLIDKYRSQYTSENLSLSDFEAAEKEYKVKVDRDNSENKPALQAIHDRCISALEAFKKERTENTEKELYEAFSDPLGDLLDKRDGHSITDNEIFASFPRYWEKEFHDDMAALGVLPADILTRVSEYVPEIVTFIEKIIENGYAYQGGGSVYFDTMKFNQQQKHHYAKLRPEAFGNLDALKEGEGVLSDQTQGKRHATDFALWKASKRGEPAWPSPWGPGRPGWHIECSVMATEVLGNKLDIHGGGEDLRFPHHDNEIAQSEAYLETDSWVNYFLHTGHLTIKGQKMSKSLKNFTTIKEALKLNSARQIRLAFLLHSWRGTLDYSSGLMDQAVQLEKLLNEFFLTVKDLLRTSAANHHSKWSKPDLELRDKYYASRQVIHDALCDSIDTRTVIDTIRSLIAECNIYIKQRSSESPPASPHPSLISHIGSYVSELMRIFGVVERDEPIGFPIGTGVSARVEDIALPFVDALGDFREKVRQEARTLKAGAILKLCDEIRDDVLPELGVRLEDREGSKPAIKFVDKETLMKEREMKLRVEEEKALEKERKRLEAEEKRLQKEKKLRTPPSELFRSETDKYSQFDEKGLPTHDAEGKELSKGQIKKLQKVYETHEKDHKEFLAANSNGASHS